MTEELLQIVTSIRQGQLIHDGSLWDHAVNATCDEFASQLLALAHRQEEKIQQLHWDYSEMLNNAALGN